MPSAVNPVAIAALTAMGTPLLAAFLAVWVAPARRDTTVSILFGIAMLLMVLIMLAAGLIAARGMAYVGPLKAALLLTAAFAVAGMVLGVRRGRAIT